MKQFSEQSLARALSSLSPKARIAFALSCCERLYPNYLAFNREQGWGTPASLRRALDLAWSSLQGHDVGADTIATAREFVQHAEPETEQFDTVLVSSALDAAAACGLLLELLAEGASSKAVAVASLSRDTVDMFVQELEGIDPSDPNLENRILEHALMQRELQRQQEDLRELSGFSATETEVAQLKAKWRNLERSNIDQHRDASGEVLDEE